MHSLLKIGLRPSLGYNLRRRNEKKNKTKRQGITTAHNNGMAVQGGRPPFSQIAKVFCGIAFVSIHMCPVSTPSLRSVGHSPQVHGTQAQLYLATSPYLYVVRNGYAQDKKAMKTERHFTPKGNALHRAGLNKESYPMDLKCG